MTLDFTLKKYEELCNVIADSDYNLLTLEEYFSFEKKPEKFIIIRHDVDDEPEYALKMAKLEKELNIKSTYYFRTIDNVFKQDIILDITRLGHEVGYHYEVLDEACGDHAMAIKIFQENLKKFENICEIKTIAQHGSPLMGKLNATSVTGIYEIIKSMAYGRKIFSNWVNIDIWKEYNFRDFGIIGEAYISMDFNDVFYFSDTGMSWNNRYRIKDVAYQISPRMKEDFKIKNTSDILDIIKNHRSNSIYILIHADQWRDSLLGWLKWHIFKYIRNSGKMIIQKIHRNKINQ